jgi:predicted nucleic acid-binding Zn ribbon protein
MNEQTKKCLFCAEDILEKAKKCKHCGEPVRKITSEKDKKNKKAKILLVVIALIAIVIFSGSGSSDYLKVGEEGVMNSNEDGNICEGIVVVGVAEYDANAYTDVIIAKDKEGQAELLSSGRVFIVQNCISIRNIEIGGALGGLSKVRFLESKQDLPHATGWIPYEFARSR